MSKYINTEELKDRFLSKTESGPSGCINWTGARFTNGYGAFKAMVGGNWRQCKAHRIAFLIAGGSIPDGLTIDHLCKNKGCVNPDHMEVVTQTVNSQRGNPIKSHCKRGHPRSPRSACYECERIRQTSKEHKEVAAKYRSLHREKAIAASRAHREAKRSK